MKRRWLAALAAIFIVSVPIGAGAEVARSGEAWFDRAVDLVRENHYDPAAIPAFEAKVADELANVPPHATANIPDEMLKTALANALASLGVSHTGHFTRDELAYYELADIFKFNFRGDLRRVFPPEGRITYPGIGMATVRIGRELFVSDVYDGGPADKAGILVGDEVWSADGAVFQEIESFRGKVGGTVTLSLRREAGGPLFDVAVPVLDLQPSDTLIRGIFESARSFDHEGRRLGYMRIWSFAGGDVMEAIADAMTGPLADAEVLVLDLRGRWGGAPPDAAELFLGGVPEFRFIDRDGGGRLANVRWRKPLVAIVDEGTRSGLEVIAYSLKEKGVPLIGTRTAGALLGGRGWLLPDDSLLEIAVAGVEIGGEVVEGVGVEPHMTVPFDIRYAAGADPQLDAALDAAVAVLAAEAGPAPVTP